MYSHDIHLFERFWFFTDSFREIHWLCFIYMHPIFTWHGSKRPDRLHLVRFGSSYFVCIQIILEQTNKRTKEGTRFFFFLGGAFISSTDVDGSINASIRAQKFHLQQSPNIRKTKLLSKYFVKKNEDLLKNIPHCAAKPMLKMKRQNGNLTSLRSPANLKISAAIATFR